MPELPKQVDGLELTPVDEGFIVYDTARDRVHYLNHMAALALLLCTGEHAAADIGQLLQRQFGLAEPPEQDVEAILAQFAEEGLTVNTKASAEGF